MKLLICGKNEAAFHTLQTVVQFFPEAEIVFGYVKNERFTTNSLPLELCAERKIRTKAFMDYGSFANYVSEFNPDFIVSAQFPLLIKKELLSSFSNRIINIHFSPLPKYRGMAPIAQAIVKGEELYGITLHIIDNGIDTGEILNQVTFPITNLTNFEIYTICNQQIPTLLSGIREYFYPGLGLSGIKQDENSASYFSASDFKYGELEISLEQTAEKIIREWRARYFPPYFPYFQPQNVSTRELHKVVPHALPRVRRSDEVREAGILKISGKMLEVSCLDAWLEIVAFG